MIGRYCVVVQNMLGLGFRLAFSEWARGLSLGQFCRNRGKAGLDYKFGTVG